MITVYTGILLNSSLGRFTGLISWQIFNPIELPPSYIYELFTTTHVPTWGLVVAGYLPAVVIVAVVLAQKGGVDYPDEFDLGNPWEGIEGVDSL